MRDAIIQAKEGKMTEEKRNKNIGDIIIPREILSVINKKGVRNKAVCKGMNILGYSSIINYRDFYAVRIQNGSQYELVNKVGEKFGQIDDGDLQCCFAPEEIVSKSLIEHPEGIEYMPFVMMNNPVIKYVLPVGVYEKYFEDENG